uniref:Uncharacterized protein n=1 Tax=Xiphophorus couchianus TaxID=32473 RepID=A0A3B5LGL7_9TELE
RCRWRIKSLLSAAMIPAPPCFRWRSGGSFSSPAGGKVGSPSWSFHIDTSGRVSRPTTRRTASSADPLRETLRYLNELIEEDSIRWEERVKTKKRLSFSGFRKSTIFKSTHKVVRQREHPHRASGTQVGKCLAVFQIVSQMTAVCPQGRRAPSKSMEINVTP